MENGWAGEDFRVILAVIIGFAVMILWFIRTHRLIVRRAKIKEEVIRNKQVIKAKKVKYWVNRGSRKGEEDDYHGIYEYEIDGQKKKYSVSSHSGVPLVELNLYYDRITNKVFSDYDKAHLGYNVGILLGIVALILTLFFTGYIGFGSLHI